MTVVCIPRQGHRRIIIIMSMLNLLLIVGSTYPDAETLEMGEQYDAAEIHRRKVDQNRGCISVLSFGPFHS